MMNRRRECDMIAAADLHPLGGLWPSPFEETRVSSGLGALIAKLRRLQDAFRTRKVREELMRLDDRMLKDIGLSRAELLNGDLRSAQPLRNSDRMP